MSILGSSQSRKPTQSWVVAAEEWVASQVRGSLPRGRGKSGVYPRAGRPWGGFNQGSGKLMFMVYRSLLPLSRDQGSRGLTPGTPSRDGFHLYLGLLRWKLEQLSSLTQCDGRPRQTVGAGRNGLTLSLFTGTRVLGPGHPGATSLEEAKL